MKNASPVATPRSHGVKRSETERRHPHLSETSWQPPGTGYESEKILVAHQDPIDGGTLVPYFGPYFVAG